MWSKPAGQAAVQYFAGRRYQALLCDANLSAGTRIEVPGGSVSGVFQVTDRPYSCGTKVALREA